MKKRALIALALIGLLLGAKFVLNALSQPQLPPDQRIRQMFVEAATALREKDWKTIMGMISDDFEGAGYDTERLRFNLYQFFRNVEEIYVTYDPPAIRVEGNRAYAQTEIKVHWDDGGLNSYHSGQIEIFFRLEKGRKGLFIPTEDWKVYRVYGLQTEEP